MSAAVPSTWRLRAVAMVSVSVFIRCSYGRVGLSVPAAGFEPAASRLGAGGRFK